MSRGQWPPPGFPLVDGRCALGPSWTVDLPSQYARRVEDGSLVLWKPGVTFWIAAYSNDANNSIAERLSWFIEDASPERVGDRSESHEGWTVYSYSIIDLTPDGPVNSICATAIRDSGQLIISAYFDDSDGGSEAAGVIASLAPAPSA